jgi:hypothetical protein
MVYPSRTSDYVTSTCGKSSQVSSNISRKGRLFHLEAGKDSSMNITKKCRHNRKRQDALCEHCWRFVTTHSLKPSETSLEQALSAYNTQRPCCSRSFKSCKSSLLLVPDPNTSLVSSSRLYADTGSWISLNGPRGFICDTRPAFGDHFILEPRLVSTSRGLVNVHVRMISTSGK